MVEVNPDYPQSQSLADSEEAFPVLPFLVKLRQSHEAVRTGTDVDFPVFLDPDVRHVGTLPIFCDVLGNWKSRASFWPSNKKGIVLVGERGKTVRINLLYF